MDLKEDNCCFSLEVSEWQKEEGMACWKESTLTALQRLQECLDSLPTILPRVVAMLSSLLLKALQTWHDHLNHDLESA